MHQFINQNVPKGSRICQVGAVPVPPRFYYLDYEVFPIGQKVIPDYILLVKANWVLQPDGSRVNTYLPKMHLVFRLPQNAVKLFETDRSTLYLISGRKSCISMG